MELWKFVLKMEFKKKKKDSDSGSTARKAERGAISPLPPRLPRDERSALTDSPLAPWDLCKKFNS